MMTKNERKWHKIYTALMVFIYIIYIPVSVIEWLSTDSGFPIVALVVGIALPFMRKNHMAQLKEEQK